MAAICIALSNSIHLSYYNITSQIGWENDTALSRHSQITLYAPTMQSKSKIKLCLKNQLFICHSLGGTKIFLWLINMVVSHTLKGSQCNMNVLFVSMRLPLPKVGS